MPAVGHSIFYWPDILSDAQGPAVSLCQSTQPYAPNSKCV